MKPFKDTKRFEELSEQAKQAKEAGDEQALNKLRNELKKEPSICGGITKSGKLCTKKPYMKEDGTTNGRCVFHGGKQTGQATEEGRKKSMANLSPKANLIHGIYSQDFKDTLTKEETELYNSLMDYYLDNYENDPFNMALVDRYALNLIKVARLDSQQFLKDSQSYNDPETKLVRYIETLGLNNKFIQSRENTKNKSEDVNLNVLFDMGSDQQ
ncbi:HGGxSTG domain-containing protein [Bacillus hominis]|uniref:HGGxSTG domain-containing protein n=1 Tax=Bacillus hominis TaxID=2817478 RepID=UPI0025A2F0A7|nr:HGGxSTG domain-containing protein [Bacillus hominis]MDM5432359.1 HGGxSTG domain-containing protein [Bacillus hominis]